MAVDLAPGDLVLFVDPRAMDQDEWYRGQVAAVTSARLDVYLLDHLATKIQIPRAELTKLVTFTEVE